MYPMDPHVSYCITVPTCNPYHRGYLNKWACVYVLMCRGINLARIHVFLDPT